jgi:outer membrane protein
VPNAPLTADEAALIALRNQPNVTVARAGVMAAEGVTQQVRSGLGPSLGVTAGYTRIEELSTESQTSTGAAVTTPTTPGGTPGTTPGGTTPSGGTGGTTTVTTSRATSGSVSGYSASVLLRQLLFDFNHTRELVRQAAAEEHAANENLTRVQADTVLQVKQAFYTYVQNNRLVTVNQTNVQNQQAHLALAQARLKSGLGPPVDVVRAQTAVSDAILNLNVAQNNTSTSRVNLALVMGIDPRTPIQAAETGEPAVESNDVQALVTTALAKRPEVRQAQDTLEAAQHSVSAAKTTNAPFVGADLGFLSNGAKFPPGNNSFTVGVSLNWTPFDSGLAAGRVREARASVLSAQAQLTNTQLTVTSDVSQAYLNLRTAEQRVTTSDAEVANAQESVRLAEGRYRAGVGTFIDVLDAQAALVTAQTNRVNAQTAVEQARAALARAVGSPVPPPR